MSKGGQGRKNFCALIFYNSLKIFHIHHHNYVKCVDFDIYKKIKPPFCIVHFSLPITQRTFGLDASWGFAFLSYTLTLTP